MMSFLPRLSCVISLRRHFQEDRLKKERSKAKAAKRERFHFLYPLLAHTLSQITSKRNPKSSTITQITLVPHAGLSCLSEDMKPFTFTRNCTIPTFTSTK